MSDSEGRRLAAATLAYAVLTAIMAWPFSLSPASTVLADNPDTHLYLWTLAWDVHAFLAQPWLIFDANIYHPYANTLAYSENLIGSAFMAAPVIWLTGDAVLAMNLTALLTCVLCGSGAFFLARQWGYSTAAAFICGVIFAFAPPRFFRMGQLHMTAMQWIPFTLAFVQGYLDRGRRRDLLLALGCFSLQVLSSGHGAAFLAVAVVLLLAWRIAWGQPVAIRTWLKDCGATGLYLLAPSVAVMIPYRAAQVEAGLRREYPSDAMPGLDSFLASPARVHTALHHVLLGREVNDTAIAYLFPGVLCLLLAVAALVSWRPHLRHREATWFFALLAAVSTLMFITWPIEPWRYVYWLPGFNFIRVPSRFILLVMLCLGMLAGAAVDRWTAPLSARARILAVATLSVLLLAEYSSHPFSGVPFRLDVPAVDRWLATQPGRLVIAEVPLPSAGDLGAHERAHTRAMLHTTAHWQKTVHGYSGIRRPRHVELYARLAAFPDSDSVDALREVGTTHVLVHTEDYPPEAWAAIDAVLASAPDLRLVHAEGPGRIYAIVPR